MTDTVISRELVSEPSSDEHEAKDIVLLEAKEYARDSNITSTMSIVPKLVTSEIFSKEEALTESRLADSELAELNEVYSKGCNDEDPVSAAESEIDQSIDTLEFAEKVNSEVKVESMSEMEDKQDTTSMSLHNESTHTCEQEDSNDTSNRLELGNSKNELVQSISENEDTTDFESDEDEQSLSEIEYAFDSNISLQKESTDELENGKHLSGEEDAKLDTSNSSQKKKTQYSFENRDEYSKFISKEDSKAKSSNASPHTEFTDTFDEKDVGNENSLEVENDCASVTSDTSSTKADSCTPLSNIDTSQNSGNTSEGSNDYSDDNINNSAMDKNKQRNDSACCDNFSSTTDNKITEDDVIEQTNNIHSDNNINVSDDDKSIEENGKICDIETTQDIDYVTLNGITHDDQKMRDDTLKVSPKSHLKSSTASDSDLDISQSLLQTNSSLNKSDQRTSTEQNTSCYSRNKSTDSINKSSQLILSLETSISDHESESDLNDTSLAENSPEQYCENETTKVILESDYSDDDSQIKKDSLIVEAQTSTISCTEKAMANISLDESDLSGSKETLGAEDQSFLGGSVVVLTDISVLLDSERKNIKADDEVKINSECEFEPVEHKTSSTTKENEYVISKQESLDFLKQILHIEDVEDLLVTDKLSLLNQIASQWLQRVPFNTILQISRDPLDRCILGLKDSIEVILNGWGGICWNHNVALYYILKSLGFKTYLTISAIMDKSELNHTVPVIKGVVEPNDAYLMDVGTGYPCFTAVSLDFTHTSPIYKESFVTYKFTKEGDVIKCKHLTKEGKDRAGRQFQEIDADGWGTYFYMWLEDKTVNYIKNTLDETVFKDLSYRFNNYILAVKFPNHRLIAIKNNNLIIESEDGHLESEVLDGYVELKDAFSQYFSEIPMDIVKDGIANARGLPFEVDKENDKQSYSSN